MRSLRNLVVLAVLGLTLGATAVSAAEGPASPAGREVNGAARFLDHLQTLLSAVWEKAACDIDPLGRCSPGGGPAQDDPAPGTDAAWEIDPLG